jgi:alpha-ketoglutarate-dependent taurine dioxygenase/4-hydroxybenzoate polyprenyltransferase
MTIEHALLGLPLPREAASDLPAVCATRPLVPFGIEVIARPGARFEDVPIDALRGLVAEHRVVVVRGLAPIDKPALPLAARRLGPLQPWSFGSVHELEPKDDAKNYLYTRREVPLHWDGAFAPRVPRYLVFSCVEAPEREGETVFVDTTRVWAKADARTRDRWRSLAFEYETERVVHYGGRFRSALVAPHPYEPATVLRFAEPVDDLNPVSVRALGLSPLESAAAITELRDELYAPDVMLAHAWKAGDVVIADNHALLHGRRGFDRGAPRHIRRVNVLGPERTLLDFARDSLRIRRPEFMIAEIPILLVPALLAVRSLAELASTTFALTIALFFLLFHFGDMINCLADRDLDAVYKTRLSEAVYGLGVRTVKLQIALTVVGALGLGAVLSFTTGRSELVALVAAGILLGAQYSTPPLWLKGRGLLQAVVLWALIFVGPMVLVMRSLSPAIDAGDLLLFACYGAMQQGIVLVNTAEDLPEDVASGIRTTAVALGLRGSVVVAAGLVAIGGGGVLACLAVEADSMLALAPFALAWVVVAAGTIGLAVRTLRASKARALEVVRAGAKRVPIWIALTAWGTLLAVVAIRGSVPW